MDGSLVKVKLNDNRKRKSRYTQVMTVSDTEWEAALSPILWCNLGGDQLCEAFISIKVRVCHAHPNTDEQLFST